MQTPSITPAQLVALILGLVTALSSAALLDSTAAKVAVIAGAFVVLAAWIVADALIRKGRAEAIGRGAIQVDGRLFAERDVDDRAAVSARSTARRSRERAVDALGDDRKGGL